MCGLGVGAFGARVYGLGIYGVVASMKNEPAWIGILEVHADLAAMGSSCFCGLWGYRGYVGEYGGIVRPFKIIGPFKLGGYETYCMICNVKELVGV